MINKKVLLVSILLSVSFVLMLNVVSATGNASINIVSPANNSLNGGTTLFNLTFINGSKTGSNLTIPGLTIAVDGVNINVTFYYNRTGTAWTKITTNNTCTPVVDGVTFACISTFVLNSSMDGYAKYAINATLSNGTDTVSLLDIGNATMNVTFDSTPPALAWQNISGNITNWGNYTNMTGYGLMNLSVTFIDATTNVSYVTFNITNSTGGTNMTLVAARLSGTNGGDKWWNNSLNFSNLPAGKYNITVWANDSLNNTITTGIANFRFTIDDVAPQVYLANISVGNFSNYSSTNLVLNITLYDPMSGIGGVMFNITNATGGTNATYLATKSGSTWSYTVDTTNFPDGIYNISVSVNDSAGNVNNSIFAKNSKLRIRHITLDNTNPTIAYSCDRSAVGPAELITCTCTSGDALSGVNATTFSINPLTTIEGTFTTNCNITDNAANLVTSTFTYSVSVGGGSSPGSGSSSNTNTWTKTYSEDSKELSQMGVVTQQLGGGNRVRLKVNSATHYVGVKSLTTTTATVEVSSTPQQATLAIGDTRKFDLDSNGYYDLQVVLNSITSGKGDISITSINEQITEESEQAQVDAQKEAEGIASGEPELPADSGNNALIWASIGIIVLILIVVAVIYFYKKKK
ncbi:MAG: Ig-like domain-containing protein [Candidatus Pacearchaeota archaeon]